MSKTSALNRFAGLLGLGASTEALAATGAIAAEKPTQRDDESDEDFQKRLKDWEDSQDGEDGKKGKKADAPKDTTDDQPNQPDDKVKKAIKDAADAARAEGHAAGISAERARWDGVLASEAAKGKPISAMGLLADTDMNAAAIQKTLAALPVESTRSTLAQRHPNPTPAPAPAAPAADGGKQPGKFAARVQQALENINGKKDAA